MTLQVYNPRIRTNSVVIQPISTGQSESRRHLAGPAGEKLNHFWSKSAAAASLLSKKECLLSCCRQVFLPVPKG